MTDETRETTIYPTTTCFDDSLENLTLLIQENPSRLTDGSLLIVHGIINPDGKEIAHAWIELDGKTVVDSGILDGEKITYSVSLEEYYRQAKITDTTKYMPVDAAGIENRTGMFGPWEERYRRLCPDLQEKSNALD